MWNKQEGITYIRKRLTEYSVFIASDNKSGYTDINKYAEDTIRDLLNAIYGYKLKNLNWGLKPNFPVIDLGDDGFQMCFQVTSKTEESFRKLTAD
jgi:hypothetical protein